MRKKHDIFASRNKKYRNTFLMNNTIDVSVIKRCSRSFLIKCSRYVLSSFKCRGIAEEQKACEWYVATEEMSIFILRSRLSKRRCNKKELHPSHVEKLCTVRTIRLLVQTRSRIYPRYVHRSWQVGQSRKSWQRHFKCIGVLYFSIAFFFRRQWDYLLYVFRKNKYF